MKKLKSYLTYNDGVATLDLSRKKLTSIPKEITQIAEGIDEKYKGKERPWKEINLSYNDIKTVTEEDFKNLNNFDIIHFIGLKIKKLPSAIKNLTNPIVLNFSWSDLVELPKEIYFLEQLKSIRVNWTEIKNFDKDIANLKNIMEIEVSETHFLRTIYHIKENDNQPNTDEEKEVWEVKNILDKMGCEIIE